MADYWLTRGAGPAASKSALLGKRPDVFPPHWFRSVLASIFSPSMANSASGMLLLPPLPRWARTLLALLLVLNAKNLPLVWHVRIFYAPILFRMRSVPAIHPLLPWIRSDAHPTREPGAEPPLKLDALPLGKDVFEHATTWTFYADFADSDWNGHLSNTSYGSRLDFVRAEHVHSSFILSHFDGCGFALGGTIFNFNKEIPMFKKYAITCRVGTWDHKWLYLFAEWTDPPDPIDSDTADVLEQTKPKRSLSSVELRKFAASVMQSQREADAKEAERKRAGVDPSYDPPSTSTAPAEQQQPSRGAGGGAKGSDKPRTVYATAVSRYCFKAGRKTIPPWFIIATSGFGRWASTRDNFAKAEALRASTLSAARREYVARTGASDLPRDGLIAGRGFRKYGIASLYDPARPEGAGSADARGLGAYQDQSSWAMAEWEERKVAGLEALRAVGGLGSVLVPPPSAAAGKSVASSAAPAASAFSGGVAPLSKDSVLFRA